jgi:hypothetical protein
MSFSLAGDVWSFGIYLWELWSIGSTPWLTYRSPRLLLQTIQAGNRLSDPMDCPQRILSLMKDCWAVELRARPHIAEIRRQLVMGIATVFGTETKDVLLVDPVDLE